MLPAGFASLVYLKSRLLPAAMVGATTYDLALAGLGKAVAARFNRYCNRVLERGVAVEDAFSARASEWVLSRYPVETLASVQLRDAAGIVGPITDALIDRRSGVLSRQTLAGTRQQQIVITYTGGYWLNPRDGSETPAGVTELPEDILEAWVLQCQHHAESRGLFEEVAVRPQSDPEKPKTAGVEFLEEVMGTLRPYRRFAGE